MLYGHPEWVRSCESCKKYEYGPNGKPLTFGADNTPIPRQGSTPCWACPKHTDDVPRADRKPLPTTDDFGSWFWKLLSWYHEGRAVGFGEVDPLMRKVAGKIDLFERRRSEQTQSHSMSEAISQLAAVIGALKRK